MMKNFIKILFTGLLLPYTTTAQQAGVTVVAMSGQNMTFAGSTLYMPAGGYLNNTGNIYVAANNIVAGTGSTLTGATGSRLHLLGTNQIDAGAPEAATLLDLNEASVDMNVTIHNPMNIELSDQAFGTVTNNGAANATVLGEVAFSAQHPFTLAPLTSNHVILNSNRFILGTAATLTGFDSGRYFVTNNNAGELRKLGLTNGMNFFYPIGRAETDYTPANLQVATGGPVDYYMNVRNFAESVPDENIGGYANLPNVSRTWTVYGSNSGTMANISLVHPGTAMYEVNGYNRSNSNVIRFDGAGWIPNLPTDAENEGLFGTGSNYWAQQITFAVPGNIGANSFYGKSNSLTVVPVLLSRFTATNSGCDGLVNFTTSMEQNNSHFNLEKSFSQNQNDWKVISTIAAAGNSNTVRDYSYRDINVNAAAAYYRLAIVSTDGSVTYSPIRLVRFNCGNQADLVIYPNPITGFVNVLLPGDSKDYVVRIMNAAGQTVLPLVKNANGLITIKTVTLSKGTYFIQVSNKDFNKTVKILKK
ncbi:MAG: T9SS type A sorting domain-containing protein [Rhizobacter sp.]|nr:T9SS type A sorting domain-containing protein [Ferruginibacter sp.]